MIRCLHCGAETTNGLALCDLCQRFATECLVYLPVYFKNLARQTRPGRPNGSLGTSGQWLIQRGESDGSKVPVVLGRAVNDLDTWARALSDDRGVDLPDCDTETETVTATCALLAEHLTSIATLEWAGQFVRDIAKHERALRQVTESTVPGWYAGACPHITGRDMEGNTYACRAPIHVVPGLTWVTCGSCGTTSHAADHLDAVLEEARDWIARPKALAHTLVALLDTEPSVPRLYDRIRRWAADEALTPIRHAVREHVYDHDAQAIVVAEQEMGPARYRLGDVLALIRRETTRKDAIEKNAAAAS